MGGSSFRTQPPSCSSTSPWPIDTCAGRRGKSLPHLLHQCCYQTLRELCRVFFTWKLSGHFVWGTQVSLQGLSCKGTFIQKGFCEVFPKFILFSNHHWKGEYIKEPLVLLISQRVVGNAAANGTTSRVWIQSLWHYLSCLSTGNSISSGASWKLFTVFKK